MTPLTTIARQFSDALERERPTLPPRATFAGDMLAGELQHLRTTLNRVAGPEREATLRMLSRRVDAFETARQQVMNG